GIRDRNVTGVQTCALPISCSKRTFSNIMTSPLDSPAIFSSTSLPYTLFAFTTVVFNSSPNRFATGSKRKDSTISPLGRPKWDIRSEERRVGNDGRQWLGAQ